MNANFFFEEMGVSTALYYIDTQKIELALLQKDFQEARRLLSESVVPPGIDPCLLYTSPSPRDS